MPNLTNNSPKIEQPAKIKLQLKEHQKTAVYAMIERETNKLVEVDITSSLYNFRYRSAVHRYLSSCMISNENIIEEKKYTLSTNFSVLADKVGAGKSLMVLALIALNPTIPQRNKTLLGTENFQINEIVNNTDTLKTNLIIVPHNIIGQWEQFASQTTLKVLVANRCADFDLFKDENGEYIDNRLILKKISKLDVVILNINRYKEFIKVAHGIRWSRVFMDEIDTIHLPSGFFVCFNFFWGITATPRNILARRGMSFIRYLFLDIYDCIDVFLIKNDDKFIDESVTIPPITSIAINSHTEKTLSLLSDMLPKNIMDLINAGNMHSAAKKLNCDVSTDKNLIDVFEEKLNKELNNAKIKLRMLKQMTPTDIDAHNGKVKHAKEVITSIRTQLTTIKDKITGIKTDTCAICMENYKTPAMVNCCRNILCLECLLSSLVSKNSCPFCRATITDGSAYSIISNTPMKTPKKKSGLLFSDMSKQVILEYILKTIFTRDECARVMIFSNYTETYSVIETISEQYEINCCELSGTSGRITNIIKSFEQGETNILFLNAGQYGAGLNLQMSDYLILYHRMDSDLEKQVIGRAHRIGKKNSLKLIYLVNNHESHDFITNTEIVEKTTDDTLQAMIEL